MLLPKIIKEHRKFEPSDNYKEGNIELLTSADILSLSANMKGSFDEKVDNLTKILEIQEPFNRPSFMFNLGKRSFPVPSYLRSIFPVYALRYEAVKNFNNSLTEEERADIKFPRYLHN